MWGPNLRFDRTTHQLRWWVPLSLLSSAAAQHERWASQGRQGNTHAANVPRTDVGGRD